MEKRKLTLQIVIELLSLCFPSRTPIKKTEPPCFRAIETTPKLELKFHLNLVQPYFSGTDALIRYR